MYRLPKDTEMTLPMLQKLLEAHKKEVEQRYQKLQNAYESNHEILHQEPKPKYKPDNRIVTNFPKYIVDTMNGFVLGNPIKIVAEDETISNYVEYLDQYNDQDDNNAELSKLLMVHGKSYEMYFTDENSEPCITYLSPIEAFMVFDDSILERPLFFVRRYTDNDGHEFGSISNEYGVRDFKVDGTLQWVADGGSNEDGWKPHYFSGVPATEYVVNSERQGLFEPVLSLVNAFNKALSEKANDIDYFADAYLKVLGPDMEEKELQHIRDNRIINLLTDDAQKIIVEFMGKPENDVGQENLLNRIERLIFQISMVANISDESFGASSGIALRYKLQAMSNLAKTIQRKFVSGMNRRYKLLFSHPASKVATDAWVQLHYQFTPNIPANILEEAQIAAQMEGITSHATQLKVLSVVDDVQKELDAIEEENAATEQTVVERTMFGTAPQDVPEEGMSDEQQ